MKNIRTKCPWCGEKYSKEESYSDIVIFCQSCGDTAWKNKRKKSIPFNLFRFRNEQKGKVIVWEIRRKWKKNTREKKKVNERANSMGSVQAKVAVEHSFESS